VCGRLRRYIGYGLPVAISRRVCVPFLYESRHERSALKSTPLKQGMALRPVVLLVALKRASRLPHDCLGEPQSLFRISTAPNRFRVMLASAEGAHRVRYVYNLPA